LTILSRIPSSGQPYAARLCGWCGDSGNPSHNLYFHRLCDLGAPLGISTTPRLRTCMRM
jgi:hypothetical protein